MSKINQEELPEATPAHGVEQLVVASNDSATEPAEEWQDEKTILLPMTSGGRANISIEIVGSGQRLDLTRFPVTIGRHPDSDIVLDEDGVSRQHASILKVDGGYAIEDNDSLNGIRINSYNVDRVLLGDGDRISIGTAELVFHYATAAKKAPGQRRKRVLGLVTIFAALVVVGIYAYRFGYLPQLSDDDLVKAPLVSNLTPSPVTEGEPQGQVQVDSTTIAANTSANESVQNDEVIQSSIATRNDSNIVIPTSDQIVIEGEENLSDSLGTEDTTLASAQEAIEPSVATDKENSTSKLVSSELSSHTDSQKSDSVSTTTSPLILPADFEEKPAIKNKKPAPFGVERSRNLITQAKKNYLEGDVEEAFTVLDDIANSNRHRAAQRDEALQAKQQLSDSYDYYLAGQREFGRQLKEKAFEQWQFFLASEQALFLSQKSVYAERVSDIVFEEYEKNAERALSEGDHHQAYRYWQRAAIIRPESEATSVLADIDQKARSLYRDGYRKETVNLTQARARWQEVIDLVPPDTEYHTKARAKLRWYAYLDQ